MKQTIFVILFFSLVVLVGCTEKDSIEVNVKETDNTPKNIETSNYQEQLQIQSDYYDLETKRWMDGYSPTEKFNCKLTVDLVKKYCISQKDKKSTIVIKKRSCIFTNSVNLNPQSDSISYTNVIESSLVSYSPTDIKKQIEEVGDPKMVVNSISDIGEDAIITRYPNVGNTERFHFVVAIKQESYDPNSRVIKIGPKGYNLITNSRECSYEETLALAKEMFN